MRRARYCSVCIGTMRPRWARRFWIYFILALPTSWLVCMDSRGTIMTFLHLFSWWLR